MAASLLTARGSADSLAESHRGDIIAGEVGTVGAPRPDHAPSSLITKVKPGKHLYHKGDGDMWAIRGAADGSLYGGAGDNRGNPMKLWMIRDEPPWGSGCIWSTICPATSTDGVGGNV